MSIITPLTILKSAYAKLNLNLTLTGEKTENGYHKLTSTFVKIDMFAKMKIDIEDNPNAYVSRTFVNDIENNKYYNTIIKAVDLWSKRRECPVIVKVQIENPLPYEAGLGASSSYAASVLHALEEYYMALNLGTNPLDSFEMQSIAIKIGADVPFFVSGLPYAYVEGIGEIISPTSPVPKEYLVHLPNYKMSTADAYKEADAENVVRFIDLRQNKIYYKYLVGITGTELWELSGSGSTFFIPSPSKELLNMTEAWKKEGITTRLYKAIY